MISSVTAFRIAAIAGGLPLIGLIPWVPTYLWATSTGAVVCAVVLLINERRGFHQTSEMPRSGEPSPYLLPWQQITVIILLLCNITLSFYIVFYEYWRYSYIMR